jgi:tetratricopeptide (TPR) repeat protein
MQSVDIFQQIRLLDDKFQRISRLNRPMEALKVLEEAVVLKHSHYGVDSAETRDAFRHFVSECSTTAMNALNREEHSTSFELLKKAESLTEEGLFLGDEQERLRLRAIIFNNLGCFYKRRNKLHASLQYLEKALNLELQCSIVENPAGTHFNMCATLSQLGRHSQALQHAMCAVEILTNSSEVAQSCFLSSDDNSMLAIAYHNLGVEYEYVGQIELARRAFFAAVEFAEKGWGPTHEKTNGIREAAHGCDASAEAAALGVFSSKTDGPTQKVVNSASRSDAKFSQAKRARPSAAVARPPAVTADSAVKKGSGKKGGPHLPKIIAPSPLQMQSLAWLENTVISEARSALLPRVGPQTPRSSSSNDNFITHVPTFAFQPLGAIPSRQMAFPSLDEPWNVLYYQSAMVLQAFVRCALVRLLLEAPSSTFILGLESKKHHNSSPIRRPATAVDKQGSNSQVPALLDKIAGLEKTLHEMEGQLKHQMRKNLPSGHKSFSSHGAALKSPKPKTPSKDALSPSFDIKVKCRAGDNIVTISVPRTVSIAALWQCITAEFGHVRSLSYKDVDCDTVSILTDRGLQVAIAEALMSPKQILLLDVEVLTEPEDFRQVAMTQSCGDTHVLADTLATGDVSVSKLDATEESFAQAQEVTSQVLSLDSHDADSNVAPLAQQAVISINDQVAAALVIAGVVTASREEERSALLLCRCYRGHRARISFVSHSLQLRTEKTCKSASIIQKVIRGRNVRLKLKNAKRLEILNYNMALKIERVVRGHLKRKIFFVIKAAAAIKRRELCASTLQSVWKGHLARLIAKALRADFQAQGLVLNRYRLLVRGASQAGLRLAYDVRIHRTVLLHFIADLNVFNRTLGVLEFLKSEYVVSVLDSYCSKSPSESSFIVYPCPDDSLHTLLLGSVLSTPDQHAIAKRLAKIIDFLHCRHFAICAMSPASFARFGPFWKVLQNFTSRSQIHT